MIPRRLRTWIFVWTPVSWLLLSLITYPKDRPLSSGAATIVKGFFAPSIGNYPPLLLLLAAAAVVAWGGTLFFVAGAGGGQHHIDYGIMGDRDGRTNYVWPGRFLNVRKHGIPPAGKYGGARIDEVVGTCQLLGVLEPNFVHVRIDGDVMDVRAIGWQKQVYHHVRVRRAGAGREWDPACELEILDY